MSATDLTDSTIKKLLDETHLPDLDVPLSECARANKAEQGLAVEIHIPYKQKLSELEQLLKHKMLESGLPGTVSFSQRIEQYQIANAQKDPAAKLPPPAPLPGVKNVIAVASGKGGVGKSTTAINLALALQRENARVGVLDADIFGPSQSLMSGVAPDTRPDTREQKYFVPIQAHGLQIMSMGFLITEQTPAVWRGPMASGALQQMLNQTQWDDLDYLIVDMPPGTGDIQLTLSQSCPLTAAIVVTTPQDIALLDAIKGIEMFRKVNIPVLGIVENMSTHTCSQCGHTEAIFGEDGGERISQQYQVPLLGRLPLDIAIRRHVDEGVPTVVAEPDSVLAYQYREIALRAILSLNKLPVEQGIPNVVNIR